MNLAKVSQNGEVTTTNSSRLAISNAQKGLSDLHIQEQEILDEVMDIRYGKDK